MTARTDSSMTYRRLGASGLDVSALCLGTMMFGGPTPERDAREIVAHARDHGVNFIDTADAYENGASERITGAAIRDARDDWIVATKVANAMDASQTNNGGLSRRWIMKACDASLARLGLDHIDIYYLHYDDYRTPLEETVHALGDLMRHGKIRYFGLSNIRGWRIGEMVHTCDRLNVPRPVVCQPYYNLLNRTPEFEVLPACDYHGLGVVPYSPIARGVLSGKYAKDAIPSDSRAGRGDRRIMDTEFREESFEIARKLAAHAQASGRKPTHLALAWLWANRVVSSIIAGPRTFDQWTDYVAALGTPWDDEDEALVDSLVRPGHPSTPGFTDPKYPPLGRQVGDRQRA